MKTEQNFTHVRGDNLALAFTVTLDNSRTLDGSETWTWALALAPTETALITKTNSSGISVDGSTNQPTVSLAPADFPTSTFPKRNSDQRFIHELQMVKNSNVETVARGTLTLISDVA